MYAPEKLGFPDELASLLQELCDLVAHAAFAIEQTAILQAEETMELEFELRGQDYPFCRIAAVLECNLELEGSVPQPGGSTLAFISVSNAAEKKVLQEAKRLDRIKSGRLIEQTNDTLVQLRLTEPYMGSVLSDRGFILRELRADSVRCKLTLEIPKAVTAQQAVNLMMSRYEDAQLLAKKEVKNASNVNESTPGRVLEALTPRQREVVETAYRCGYFDSPRRASGDDVADLFGFSNAAFHQHVRKAEQTLFEKLIEGVGGSLTAAATIDE